MADATSERLATAVGETTKKSIQITGDDGSSFPAEVYTGVNVTDDPQLREPLVEGTLNEVESPHGDERTYRPAVPVTYHDEDKKLFVLVIPEPLRHDEFGCRAELLERLSAHPEAVPRYMRRFEVVFDPAEIERLENRESRKQQPASDDGGEEKEGSHEEGGSELRDELEQTEQRLDEKRKQLEKLQQRVDELEQLEDEHQTVNQRLDEVEEQLEEEQQQRRDAEEALEDTEQEYEQRVDELEKQLEEEQQQRRDAEEALEDTEQEYEQRLQRRAAELDEREQKLDERAEQLDERDQQLDERDQQLQQVADRTERDSARIDEARQKLDQREAELEHLRQKLDDRDRKLQVRELNLEQKELQQKQEAELAGASDEQQEPEQSEGTQVVTDSQFIEVVDVQQHAASASKQPEAEASGVEQPSSSNDQLVSPAGPPESTRPQPTEATIMTYDPDNFFEQFEEVAEEQHGWFVESSDDLVVVGYAIGDDRAENFLEYEPTFLFQLQEVEGVPLISLTLAAFDDEDECVEAAGAVLADATQRERSILDDVALHLHVHLAIYGDDGRRITAWEAGAPIRRNIGWARTRLRRWREQHEDHQERIEQAVETFQSDDIELVGAMHHPFDDRAFVEFDGASDVKLAVGIVDYWSTDEQFEYLIGNRCFPLESFRQIQQRVVRQALHWGIVPGRQLRELAVEESIVTDEESLVQRLLSNYAEVCVGLRPNDLDPVDQWENWDELLDLAEAHDITPDAEVVELAEVSLKRAEEYEEMLDEEGPAPPVDAVGQPPESEESMDVTSSTVSRRSDQSGVTYFVAKGREDDAFDELMELERHKLQEALQEDDRCVEAAQVLVERFGAEVLDEVLEAAEQMEDAQVAALARFVEARADDLEALLMQGLDTTGANGAFIAARALAAIESTAAIPRLLEVVRDPQRRGENRRLARCLALFGDKLVAPLTEQLEDSPDDEGLLEVFAALEEVRQGTIDQIAKESDEDLDEAAARARQLE